ncbi:permease-like cell division protein FtsX [Bacillus inaquosorum]|nr:permease-like cell division protein FtsX [Bacillus inaquosorum]
MEGHSECHFFIKRKELDQLVDSFGDSGKSLTMQDQENPLNDAFVVKTTDPHDTPNVAKRLKNGSCV